MIFPIKNGDFTRLCQRLPEGIGDVSEFQRFARAMGNWSPTVLVHSTVRASTKRCGLQHSNKDNVPKTSCHVTSCYFISYYKQLPQSVTVIRDYNQCLWTSCASSLVPVHPTDQVRLVIMSATLQAKKNLTVPLNKTWYRHLCNYIYLLVYSMYA